LTSADLGEVAALVDAAATAGITLSVTDGRLECHAPAGALTPELVDRLRADKAKIVELLTRDRDPARPHPLTANQRSVLFHQRMVPDSAAYNLGVAVRLAGAADVARLDAALCDVVARYAILRTTFSWAADEPTQSAGDVPATILTDVTAAAAEHDATIARLLDAPFDLEREIPVRAALVRDPVDATAPTLVLVVHHVAADLWSMEQIFDDWMARYSGGPALPSAPPGFVAEVRREARWSRTDEARQHLEYWRTELGGELPVLDLPFDRPRPPLQSFRGDRLSVVVDGGLGQRLAQVARAADASPNMLFLSAFQVLLHKHSGLDDIVIGTPAAGRQGRDRAGIVGFLANPVVVRSHVDPDGGFDALLARTRAAVLRGLDRPYPFTLLVDSLALVREPARSPIFQVMYVWQQPRTAQDRTIAEAGQRGAPYDVTLAVSPGPQGFTCTWTYNTDLFDEATVRRLAAGLTAILRAIADDPAALVSQLPSVDAESAAAMLRAATGPQVPLDGAPGWVGQFIAQAGRTPAASALVCGSEVLTYEQLAARVAGAAAGLRDLGVTAETRVGLCMSRSEDLVVAMLAIAAAGGAYVPLDPEYPRERLAYMADDAEVALCVVDSRGAAMLSSFGGALVRMADLGASTVSAVDVAGVGDLAYLIYTSGTTGRPKGVMVTNRNVTNLFAGLDRSVGSALVDGKQPVWLAVTSVCFDISVVELLWTLCRGFRVVLDTGLRATVGQRPEREVGFGLFYFSADSGSRSGPDMFRLLMEGARFADENGFTAVWVPERHFHAFGGAYPNPAVLGSAVAVSTRNVAIRAGSVVLPLHDPLRVAEEWAVVDNLSGGRVGLSFASGWQPRDFVLAPDRFADRRESMWTDIETVRRLWRGEPVRRRDGVGKEVDVAPLPRSVQPELPVWATAAGSEETFRRAGERGLNLLTHLLGQNVEELTQKISVYRRARAEAGHDRGVVTLMLHTFVHPDDGFVLESVREPFKEYLRSSLDLMRGLAKGLGVDPDAHREMLVDHAFERYVRTSALFGTPEQCAALVTKFNAAGVDEIACLIDFGVEDDLVLDSLRHLNSVRALCEPRAEAVPLPALIERHGVTHLQCTPALAKMLLLQPDETRMPRHLLVGGDAAPPGLAAQLRDAGVGEVLNMYGPTETCVWSAVEPLGDTMPAMVGGAIANTSLYCLDSRLSPTPPGVVGELWIGGEGVARGYWRRPDLTDERFRPDPFSAVPGTRMYRTGDLVKPVGDGRFVFLGRSDNQVKVRGFRIEIGEVESAVARHGQIQANVVVARSDGQGDSILVAFVVPRDPGSFDGADLRAVLRRELPEYMVPSRIVVLDQLPLTINGKVDRARLVAGTGIVDTVPAAPLVRPRTPTEKALESIWAQMLERSAVGIDENFFEIGGHSLLAAKMHALVVSQGIADLALVDLFSYPTIAALAEFVDSRDGASHDAEGDVDARAELRRAGARQQRTRRGR
jgi:natural product biosynthesis luciferase-like monooxygenase protein